MNIEAFLLCDAATEQQGKLNVLGAFDTIWTRSIPAKHPACAIATRIRFERIEEGPHSVRIQVIDQDGRNIGPRLDGKVDVHPSPEADSAVTNLVLNIQGIEIPQYGTYRIDLAVDGKVEASLPLRLVQAT